jgi:hypothetical protein
MSATQTALTVGTMVQYRDRDSRVKNALVIATPEANSHATTPAPSEGTATLAVFSLSGGENYVRTDVPEGEGPLTFSQIPEGEAPLSFPAEDGEDGDLL